jgi:hypothetical protein
MADNIETELRKALDARAHEIEVPEGLAERTLAVARAEQRAGFSGRLRAWRDGRRTRFPVSGYPRVLYGLGAVATAVMLFVIGTFVTRPGGLSQPVGVETVQDQSGTASSGDAVAGQAAGVVSSGEADVDAAKRNEAAPVQDAPMEVQPQSGGGSVGAPDIAPVPPVGGSKPSQLSPKLIRTADVQIEVDRFETAWAKANSVASRFGGYVTNSNTELIKNRLGRGTLTMRVPAAKLDATLTELRKLGTLAQMSTSGNDVSVPIADVKARIKVLETERLQLLELLGRANNVSETLEVRNRLDETQQEIEALKAQRDTYQDEVDFSTINATVFEKGLDPNDGGGDGILIEAWRTALRIGLTIVAGTLVVLGGLIPLAALGIAIWFVVRGMRRRRSVG